MRRQTGVRGLAAAALVVTAGMRWLAGWLIGWLPDKLRHRKDAGIKFCGTRDPGCYLTDGGEQTRP